MRTKPRLVLLPMAVVAAILILAVPALAASNMKQGDSKLVMPKAMVTDLQARGTTITPLSPVTFTPKWSFNGNSLTWLYTAPMAMKSGSNFSTYNTKTGKGAFYHSGALIWVEAGAATQKGYKWQGLRIIATDKTHYSLVATLGNKAPYTPGITVGLSAGSVKVTHSGKKYTIDGVKFYLTPTAQSMLQTALGKTYSTSSIMFDGDLHFTMK